MLMSFERLSKLEGRRLPKRFQVEGITLPTTLICAEFDLFYSERLRRSAGQRIGSTRLREEYLAWADLNGSGGLSFKELRAMMELKGHRQMHSNSIHYCDVRLANPDETAATLGVRHDDAGHQREIALMLREVQAALDRLVQITGIQIAPQA